LSKPQSQTLFPHAGQPGEEKNLGQFRASERLGELAPSSLVPDQRGQSHQKEAKWAGKKL
jgi:hypothetical protein